MKNPRPLVPVASAKTPKYPTKAQVLLRPSILCAVPQRWKTKPVVCAALLFTVASGLAGCASADTSAGASGSSASTLAEEVSARVSPGTSASASESISQEPSATASPSQEPSADIPDLLEITIPVFEHGSGRSSYGCMSVAPPVFLSEEEALQVIQEEAAAQGVMFTESKTLSGTFPATSIYGDPSLQDATYDGELELDGYDAALNIGVEFVSRQDVTDWQQAGEWATSVETYEMLDTAQRLSKAAPGVAVFYDPAADSSDFNFEWDDESGDNDAYVEARDAYVEAYSAAQKERMLEDLRAQVRDFLQWLSAQGVI